MEFNLGPGGPPRWQYYLEQPFYCWEIRQEPLLIKRLKSFPKLGIQRAPKTIAETFYGRWEIEKKVTRWSSLKQI